MTWEVLKVKSAPVPKKNRQITIRLKYPDVIMISC